MNLQCFIDPHLVAIMLFFINFSATTEVGYAKGITGRFEFSNRYCVEGLRGRIEDSIITPASPPELELAQSPDFITISGELELTEVFLNTWDFGFQPRGFTLIMPFYLKRSPVCCSSRSKSVGHFLIWWWKLFSSTASRLEPSLELLPLPFLLPSETWEPRGQ